MQFFGPFGAIAGILLQIPDIAYDAKDFLRSVYINGWNKDTYKNLVHLGLDIPAISIIQRIPYTSKLGEWLAKHDFDEVLSIIGATDDTSNALDIDWFDPVYDYVADTYKNTKKKLQPKSK